MLPLKVEPERPTEDVRIEQVPPRPGAATVSPATPGEARDAALRYEQIYEIRTIIEPGWSSTPATLTGAYQLPSFVGLCPCRTSPRNHRRGPINEGTWLLLLRRWPPFGHLEGPPNGPPQPLAREGFGEDKGTGRGQIGAAHGVS